MQNNEEKLIHYTSNFDSTSGLWKCKVMKPLIYEERGGTMLEWFQQQEHKGPLLLE
jgi:hypothetical protein